jgi:hypothetical protein
MATIPIPRRLPSTVVIVVIGALCANEMSACGSSSKLRPDAPFFRDSTGAEFIRRDGPGNGLSPLVPRDGAIPFECDPFGIEWELVGRAPLSICAQPLTDSSTSNQPLELTCRPVVCESDADCPIGPDGADIVCRAGLCRFPADFPLLFSEVLSLCLSDVPRPTDCHDAGADLASQRAVDDAWRSCGDPSDAGEEIVNGSVPNRFSDTCKSPPRCRQL